MGPRKITLSIDRITVTGTRLSRAKLAPAIERELTVLLAAPGALEALRGSGAVPRLDAGQATPKGPGEAALGAAVVRATMGVLRR